MRKQKHAMTKANAFLLFPVVALAAISLAAQADAESEYMTKAELEYLRDLQSRIDWTPLRPEELRDVTSRFKDLPDYLKEDTFCERGTYDNAEYPEENRDRCRELLAKYYFNSVYLWKLSSEYLDWLQKKQSHIRAELHAAGWHRHGDFRPVMPSEERLNFIREHKDHPNLGGWSVFDEILPGYYEEIEKAVAMIREMDDNHPVGINLGAPPVPWYRFQERLDQIRRFDKIFDSVTADPYRVPGDLCEVGTVADYLRDNLSRSTQFGLVIQGTPARTRAIGWRRPRPEEIRIMTYYGISHGADLIRYWTYYSKIPEQPNRGFLSDEFLPTDRMNEIGILNAEALIARYFTGSKNFVRNFTHQRAGLHFGEFQKENEKLLVALRVPKARYLSGTSKGVKVEVEVPEDGYSAYSVSFPRVEELEYFQKGRRLEITLRPIDLTDLILITNNENVVTWAKKLIEKLLPSASAMAVRGIAWKLVLAGKQETNIKKLIDAGYDFKEQLHQLAEAKRLSRESQDMYANGNFVEAFVKAREADASIRRMFQTIYDVAAEHCLPVAVREYGEPQLLNEVAVKNEMLDGLLGRIAIQAKEKTEGEEFDLWIYGYHFRTRDEEPQCDVYLSADGKSETRIGGLPFPRQNRLWRTEVYLFRDLRWKDYGKGKLKLTIRVRPEAKGPAGAFGGKLFGVYIMPPNDLSAKEATDLAQYAQQRLQGITLGVVTYPMGLRLQRGDEDTTGIEVPILTARE